MPCHGGPSYSTETDKQQKINRIANAIACSVWRNDFMAIDAVANDPESGLTAADIAYWEKAHQAEDDARKAREAAEALAAAERVVALRRELFEAEAKLGDITGKRGTT